MSTVTMTSITYCILCDHQKGDPPQLVCFADKLELARSLAKGVANEIREKIFTVARYDHSTKSYQDCEVIKPDVSV